MVLKKQFHSLNNFSLHKVSILFNKQHFYNPKEQHIWEEQGDVKISYWQIENEPLVQKFQNKSHGRGKVRVFLALCNYFRFGYWW